VFLIEYKDTIYCK